MITFTIQQIAIDSIGIFSLIGIILISVSDIVRNEASWYPLQIGDWYRKFLFLKKYEWQILHSLELSKPVQFGSMPSDSDILL